jgi:RHH-type proline utilization regulon transcriptional repressor/proline dehydrogenase/delta 1-pyrroline-5-carboxylate dehydrogenase
LEEGIKLVNNSEYGLTSGLQTLDEDEIKIWKNSIEAGNLYINRGITGAIVNRQPFGGMKRSAFGGGIKAGGPNYVSCFVKFEQKQNLAASEMTSAHFPALSALLSESENTYFQQVAENYQTSWLKEFAKEYHTQYVYGEKNTFRYLPIQKMGFRIQPGDQILNLLMVIAAAKVTKADLTVSIDEKDPKYNKIKEIIGESYPLATENERLFLGGIKKYNRIRTLTSDLSDAFYEAAAKCGLYIATQPPVPEGRVELLHYLREQSISYEYHRYGSISEEINIE